MPRAVHRRVPSNRHTRGSTKLQTDSRRSNQVENMIGAFNDLGIA
jgi:hypothetical protein